MGALKEDRVSGKAFSSGVVFLGGSGVGGECSPTVQPQALAGLLAMFQTRVRAALRMGVKPVD